MEPLDLRANVKRSYDVQERLIQLSRQEQQIMDAAVAVSCLVFAGACSCCCAAAYVAAHLYLNQPSSAPLPPPTLLLHPPINKRSTAQPHHDASDRADHETAPQHATTTPGVCTATAASRSNRWEWEHGNGGFVAW